MTNDHLVAVMLSLAIYALLGVSFFGWGRCVYRRLGGARQSALPICCCVWLGWAVALFIFQVLHLVFAMTVYVTLPVFLLGVVLCLPAMMGRCRERGLREMRQHAGLLIGVLVLGMLVSMWIASRAMLGPMNGDSGLYHFSAIRWIKSFPIVPGLGNLHGRLGFNQSFFVYAAVVDFHPWLGHGRSIANSFLLLLSLATVVEFFVLSLKQASRDARATLVLSWAVPLFALPVLMYFVLSSDGLASPSPDLTASLLQVVMLVMFAFLLGNREVNHPSQRTVAIALIFLAITAVTVKLSGLAFAGVIYVLVIFHVWRFCKTRRRDICLIVAATFLIASVWCARSYVLTGAPLYPSTVGYVTTEWSVPIELMKEEANWIYSWARQPREDWRNVLGSWDWLKPWYEKMYQRSVDMRHPIFVTILVGVICLLLGFGSKRQHKDQRQRMVGLWLILPLVAGVLFWFFTAPDPRFVHAQILLLPAVTSAILLTLLHGRMRKRLFLTTAALIFFTVNFNFIADLQHHPWHHKLISTTGWQPVRQVKLEARTTDSGLQVYIPITGDQCWDAPLPCTPYFKTELRLRDPDDLAAGFALTPSATK